MEADPLTFSSGATSSPQVYTGYSIKTSPTMTGAERAKKYRERQKAKNPEAFMERERERQKERRARNGMEMERKKDRERKRRKRFIEKLEALKRLNLESGVENNLFNDWMLSENYPLDYNPSIDIDIVKTEHLDDDISDSGLQDIDAIKTESLEDSMDTPENLINEENLYYELTNEKQKCEKCGKFVKHMKAHLNNIHKAVKKETGKVTEPIEIEDNELKVDISEKSANSNDESPNDTENFVKLVSTEHRQLLKNLINIQEMFEQVSIICMDGKFEFNKLLLVSASSMLRVLLVQEQSENTIIMDCCNREDVQTSLLAYFNNRHDLVSKSIAKVFGLILERKPDKDVEPNDPHYPESDVDYIGDYDDFNNDDINNGQDESRDEVLFSPIMDETSQYDENDVTEEPRNTKTKLKSAVRKECPKCGKHVKYLKNHLLKAHQEEKKKCPKCGKSVKYLKNHLSSFHGEETRDIEMDLALKKKCPECGRLVLHLRKHLAYFHKKKAQTKPRITNKLLQSFDPVELEKLFQAFAPDMESGEVICHLCAKSFTGLEKFKTHLKLDHKEGQEKFECTLCNRIFLEKRLLKAHQDCVHGEKNVLCVECGKRFVRTFDLNKHIRIKHEGIITPETVPCQAKDCNRLFKTIGFMNAHYRRTHQKVTFECKVCQTGGFTTKTWRTHRLRYHPELIRRKRKMDV